MTHPGPTSIPHRLDPGPVGDKDSKPIPLSASHAAADLHRSKMNEFGAILRGGVYETRPSIADDATRPRLTSAGGHSSGRDPAAAAGARDYRPAAYSTPILSESHIAASDNGAPQLHQRHHLALSRTNSQGTNSTNDADPVFTPPTSGGRFSPGTGSAHGSSQESQLLQLSQIAAAQERIPEDAMDVGGGASSRKRMADGMVKHTRDKSNVSPRQMVGHSRNTSTVSMASTAGSRIGEVLACPVLRRETPH